MKQYEITKKQLVAKKILTYIIIPPSILHCLSLYPHLVSHHV